MMTRRRSSEEQGFTIVEVLVAIFIIAMAAMATYGLLTTATRSAQRAKANQVALEFAEQELERLRSEPDENLALIELPGHSNNSMNPDFRIRNNEFALQREPLGEYGKLAYNGGEVEGSGTGATSGFLSHGTVVPFEPFESGDVKGKIFRYVVWRNDASCEACPTKQDYKQIVVAVRVDNAGSDSAAHGYFEVQSKFINPKKNAESNPPKDSAGNYVTAQQFYLTDTPCAPSGVTERQEPTENHLLHNTLGTCASGLKTGSTEVGAPDALTLSPPADPAPEDPEIPGLYDYAHDVYLESQAETDKGLQIPRSTTTNCGSFSPTGTEHPESIVHRWVTDKVPSDFTLSGRVTLEFFSRTYNNQPYSGGLCIYLFKREESGSPPVATNTLLKNLHGLTPSWLYAPPGTWPLSQGQAPLKWERVRVTMELSEIPYKIPAGSRLGLALSVDPAYTSAPSIPIMYDFPTMASRLEVDTTTPIEGAE